MKTLISRLIAMALVGYAAYSIIVFPEHTALFTHAESVILVLGGTFAASLMSFNIETILKAFLSFFKGLIYASDNQSKIREIKEIITIAERVNETNGFGCIDDMLEQKKKYSDFVRLGLELISAGYSEVGLRVQLTNFADELDEEERLMEDVWFQFANYAPALGMVGTVIGLILMLDNLDVNSLNIGAGLSLALLTTLYGVCIANFIFKPTARFLAEERLKKSRNLALYLEAMLMVQKKTSPILMKDYLNSSLPIKLQLK